MDRTKAAKLIRMLSSDHDGEVIAAAKALCRMGVHDVANAMEDRHGYPLRQREADQAEIARLSELVEKLQYELTKFRHGYPLRQRKADQAEIARLSDLVEQLQNKLTKFVTRCCCVCDEPFVAGRIDAITCSPRCRAKLFRRRRGSAAGV